MMLTTKGRYAVMAMVDLSSQCCGKPVTLSDIATRQEIALPYLEQIFAKLRRSGLVNSVRGPGGGYQLARGAEDIFVSDIIAAVDESIKMTRCEHRAAAGCMGKKVRCLTHDLWEGLGNQIYNYLRAISLRDICDRQVSPAAMFMAPQEAAREAAL